MAEQTQIAFDFDLPAVEKQPEAKPVFEKKAVPEEPKTVEAVIEREEVVEVVFQKVKTDNKKETRGRMSLKDMDSGVNLIEVPEDDILFQKAYYSIGVVSEMFKVNQSLIRFWENEFTILKPKKNGKGDRLFRPEDVKNLKMIYHLLRERKYTIEGAKEFLKNNKRAEERFAMIESLKRTKAFLNELKANL